MTERRSLYRKATITEAAALQLASYKAKPEPKVKAKKPPKGAKRKTKK